MCLLAGLSLYASSFLDNVGLPSGGLKAKEIARTIFGQKIAIQARGIFSNWHAR